MCLVIHDCLVISVYLHVLYSVLVRTGWNEKEPVAHKLLPMLQKVSNGKLAAVMVRIHFYAVLTNTHMVDV